jgi:hypothetical protein
MRLKVPPGSRCVDPKTPRRLAAPERPARQPQRQLPNHIIEATERRQLQITSLKSRDKEKT